MIGFQCAPQQQQNQQRPAGEPAGQQVANSKTPPTTTTNQVGSARDQHLAQISQHCHSPSLVSHHQMSLLASAGPQQAGKATPGRPVSSSPTTSSSPSPTHLGNQREANTNGQQQQQAASRPHKAPGRRVSSPGYHSAASSPGSSSIASPVSSAASTASSSGVSSAASSSISSSGARNPPAHILGPNGHSPQLQQGQTIISCTTANVSSPHPAGPPTCQPNGQPSGNQAARQVAVTGGSNLLEHFPELNQDGLGLSWFHGANNRQALNGALASSKLIVAGDISLAEMSRYPVPIMARPPLGVSDLTLETWLSDVIQARKGIKLTFTSTRTVEPAFRVLARHAQNLRGPLILSADILTRPSQTPPTGSSGPRNSNKQAEQQQQDQQPVDAWTFLMLCRTRFPRSIISIGWCPAANESGPRPTTCGPDSSIQPADSSTGHESTMFELDMMMDQHQGQAAGVAQLHHSNQPILHLPGQEPRLSSLSVVQQLAAVAAAAAANNHPAGHHNAHHLGGRLGVGPAGGAVGGPNQRHHFISTSSGSLNSSSGNSSGSPSPTSPIGHLMSQAQPHNPRNFHAHLQRHHALQEYHPHLHPHQLAHNLQGQAHHTQHQQRPSSAEQLILAAAAAAEHKQGEQQSLLVKQQQQNSSQVVGWPAMAAAAMVAASTFQQRRRLGADEDEHEAAEEDEAEREQDEDDDEEEEEEDQLPLNLNINEADPQHNATSNSSLSDLAQKIQSLQQHSKNLSALSSSLSKGGLHQNSSEAAMALASKLFSNSSTSAHSTHHGNKWEHITKKAALANRLNSNSPSPVSTSPKQQGQHHPTSGNLLCVKPTHLHPHLHPHQLHHNLHHNHSLANLALATQNPNALMSCQPSSRPLSGPNANKRPSVGGIQNHQNTNRDLSSQGGVAGLGYTREMIDKMASLVKEYNLTQAITFPVEARLVMRNNSLAELQRLLYQVGAHSTLTIVAQQEDLISVEDLITIRKHFSAQQLLFDLPDELAASLRQELEG